MGPSHVTMDFALRPASTGWEPLALVPGTAIGIWVWCKPLHAPLELIVRVPAETFQAVGGMLSLRQVVAGAGAEMGQVQGLSIQGTFIDALGGTNPLLDHAVPTASPWVEVSIRMLPVVASYVAAPVAGCSAEPTAWFGIERHSASWIHATGQLNFGAQKTE